MLVTGASRPQCVLDIFWFVEFNMNNKHNYYSPTLNSIPFTLCKVYPSFKYTITGPLSFFPGCSVFPQVLCEVWQQRLRKPHLISFSDPVGFAETHFLPPSNFRFRFSKSIFVWKLWLWPMNSTPLGACEVANLGRFPLECLLRSLWRNGIKLLSLNTTTHFQVNLSAKPQFCQTGAVWVFFFFFLLWYFVVNQGASDYSSQDSSHFMWAWNYTVSWRLREDMGCSTKLVFVNVLTISEPWSY